jgi:hypothetical protein
MEMGKGKRGPRQPPDLNDGIHSRWPRCMAGTDGGVVPVANQGQDRIEDDTDEQRPPIPSPSLCGTRKSFDPRRKCRYANRSISSCSCDQLGSTILSIQREVRPWPETLAVMSFPRGGTAGVGVAVKPRCFQVRHSCSSTNAQTGSGWGLFTYKCRRQR